MKFLVDAQLPKRLSLLLNELGFESIHTLDLPEKNNSTDHVITAYAEDEGRVIITKDFDFLQSQIILGQPKKLILIKTGNIRNSELINLIKLNIEQINSEIQNNSLVEVYTSEIVSKK